MKHVTQIINIALKTYLPCITNLHMKRRYHNMNKKLIKIKIELIKQ